MEGLTHHAEESLSTDVQHADEIVGKESLKAEAFLSQRTMFSQVPNSWAKLEKALFHVPKYSTKVGVIMREREVREALVKAGFGLSLLEKIAERILYPNGMSAEDAARMLIPLGERLPEPLHPSSSQPRSGEGASPAESSSSIPPRSQRRAS